MANRINQISGHLSAAHARGLLTGEVAIITGELTNNLAVVLPRCSPLGDHRRRPGAGRFNTSIPAKHTTVRQGIGKATAILFAKEGAKVVLSE